MRTPSPRLLQGICALALVGAAYIGMQWLPLQRVPKVIIGQLNKPITALLQHDQPLTQTIRVSPGTYSGVMFFSESPLWDHRHLTVTVRDSNNQLIASGASQFTRYTDDLLRIRVPVKWFTVTEPTSLTFTIILTSGPALPVLISTHDSPDGKLIIAGKPHAGELALSLSSRTTLPTEVQLGVMAGLCVLLGVVLIRAYVPTRWHWRAAATLLVLVTPLAIGGYWFSPNELGIADWDYYFSLHHTYRKTLLTHHQFPVWTPYICGGTAGLADPEFPGFTPTFLLELLFGIPAGLRLAILLATTSGALGMLALSRALRLSWEAGLVAALGVTFSTVTLLEITEGHVNVFAVMWIPWIWWSWLHAYRARSTPPADVPPSSHTGPRRWLHTLRALPQQHPILILSLVLTLTFFQGGIYLLTYTGFALLLVSLFMAHKRIALTTTLIATLWSLGFAGVKLIPVLFWLRQFPDESFASSTYTLPWLIDIFFGRHLHNTYVIFRQASGWHEYGAYIGYFLFGLALIGLTNPRRRLTFTLALGTAIVVIISASGPALKPVFDYLWFFPRSNISRLILYAVISLSLLAALGLDQLKRHLKPHSFVIPLLIGLIAVDLMSLTYPLSEQAFTLPRVYPGVSPAPAPIAFTPDRFDAAGTGNRTTRAFTAIEQGYGTLSYCSVLGPTPAVTTIYDKRGAEYLHVQDQRATTTLHHWSPQTVRLSVTTPETTIVTLNTNFARGWYVNDTPAIEADGRVSARVSAGTHDLTFTYHPPGAYPGLALSAATISLAGAELFRRRRTRRSRSSS